MIRGYSKGYCSRSVTPGGQNILWGKFELSLGTCHLWLTLACQQGLLDVIFYESGNFRIVRPCQPASVISNQSCNSISVGWSQVWLVEAKGCLFTVNNYVKSQKFGKMECASWHGRIVGYKTLMSFLHMGYLQSSRYTIIFSGCLQMYWGPTSYLFVNGGNIKHVCRFGDAFGNGSYENVLVPLLNCNMAQVIKGSHV